MNCQKLLNALQIHTLLLIAATATCPACDKAPSESVAVSAWQSAPSQTKIPIPEDEAGVAVTWHGEGQGTAEIPVQKGMPLFSVHINDDGGAHCCQEVQVYAPDGANLVYDSGWYGAYGRITLLDIDGDGSTEIVHNLATFHYYDGLCYYCSPFVDAIFAYDQEAGRFVPANERFPALWQDTLEEARNPRPVQELIPNPKTAKDSDEFEHFRQLQARAVARAANLILAGYENEAYAWLAHQFTPEEGQRVCHVLHQHLNTNGHYLFLKKLKLQQSTKTTAERSKIFAADFKTMKKARRHGLQ